MTDHYQGNIFTEYTALKTQRGKKKTLNDGKSIRLGQQNVTLSLFSIRAVGKKGKREEIFYQPLRDLGSIPLECRSDLEFIAVWLYPSFLQALRVNELALPRFGDKCR